MADADTIFALSSGRPPAAIAVVRISGPAAGEALASLIGRIPPARQAVLARVRDPASGEPLDQALALYFPGPKSETGEDTAELQLHGGRAVIAAVLAALGHLPGLRPAEAGEFTRRAFANGRLDLTAVEGLADLIAAETEAQRRQALQQLQGALAVRAEAWRSQLIEALARVEAGIDFVDESDVPTDLVAPALTRARGLRDEIAVALADDRRGERLRDGLTVAIAGPPNAGKSSLLNRIARREAAIVSPFAGTTRDVIEIHLDLDGYPVTLLDTAGIRASTDPVEMEGVRRAEDRALSADLLLWVVDASERPATTTQRLIPSEAAASAPTTWTIRNKLDLVTNGPARWSGFELTEGGQTAFAVSALTGVGIPEFLAGLTDYVRGYVGSAEPALVTRDRHRRALEETVAALDRALAEAGGPEDLVAEELRLAARALGRLTGRVDVEDVLDVIFRDFCIGK